jgi:hypothetical protein
MTDRVHAFLIFAPGPRPPFSSVAEHLWGKGCDFDSDGDSANPDARDWTELTVTRRPQYVERVDVGPVEGYPTLVLRVRSDRKALAEKAAKFIAKYTGGRLQAE